MIIIEAEQARRHEINLFYREQGYHRHWSDTERAFVCLFNNKVVGSVKVESIDNINVLRGMYITEKFQGKGLGRRLLRFIEPVLNLQVSYCMPLAHVSDFYEYIGFSKVLESEFPIFLQERCEEYRKCGYQISTMIRESTTK